MVSYKPLDHRYHSQVRRVGNRAAMAGMVVPLQEKKRFLEKKVLEKDLEVYLKVTFREGIM